MSHTVVGKNGLIKAGIIKWSQYIKGRGPESKRKRLHNLVMQQSQEAKTNMETEGPYNTA